MNVAVISPHLDDAALSLGQTLAQLDNVTVVTVFAGSPAHGVLSDYDRAAGFSSSLAAMGTRHVEDSDALRILGARHDHWPFLDAQYRAEDLPDLVGPLQQFTEETHQRWAPIGLGHPDHVTVSDACATAWNGTVLWYEELPYRVLHPEQVPARMRTLQKLGWKFQPVPFPLDGGFRIRKADAIRCYRSQFPTGVDDPCLFVPERAWLATR